MDESSKSKRVETREFWEEAIRLWAESGLSVREFCNREGLAEHSFYSWRRELMPESPAPEVNQESSATEEVKHPPMAGDDVGGSRLPVPPAQTHLPSSSCRSVSSAKKVPRARAASAETAAGAAPIEIVGASPWRVRILAGFDPAALAAVLTVLEGRRC